ncbi:MAG TPA: acyl carrier protein [Xanthomonadales bacterium]|nr:acyl carrier protein [Xanthomonadales bacterium]
MDRNQMYEQIREILVNHFEIDPALVTPEANLYRELDIDSIDAVDLLVKLRELTDQRISPEDFQQVRTISDVLDKLAE